MSKQKSTKVTASHTTSRNLDRRHPRLAIPLILCLLAAGCGSATSTSTPTAPAATSSTPTAAQVKQWPSKWCKARPGITEQQLFALMGQPTENDGDAAKWQAYGYLFIAFFNTSGHVRQLDIDAADLTGSERASIRCPTTRVAQ